MDKVKQKQLLTEVMNEDANDGLYKQQTAVEWLQECLLTHFSHEQIMQFEGLFQQAKEMEKEQIIKAHGTKSNGRLKNDGQFIIGEITGEQYYKDTYESNNRI